ncbi:MAG: integrase [Ruminococcaceae bacterium]|nr:integrase [Oscillospiraceae bacterium]MBQ7119786.1 tyrosine-type recombinase/integrase [Oscillospiraceae bacterium]
MEITRELIGSFEDFLINEEKADATVKKYLTDVCNFANRFKDEEITKMHILKYKKELLEKLSPTSVNASLSSLNTFFSFCGRCELKAKMLKIQRNVFLQSEKELTKEEYSRLLAAAERKGNERLLLIMQTICATGIRVSELKFITVESVKEERAEINCKGKLRCVMIPRKLCRALLKYARKEKVMSGSVFVTRGGKPLDRSNIWADMKKLCESAKVSKDKVFPHNLRHLFARTYYSLQKDIVRLADILGHSSVNTTRIYTMENGEIHRRQIQNLGLLRC